MGRDLGGEPAPHPDWSATLARPRVEGVGLVREMDAAQGMSRLGEMALLAPSRRMATVRAVAPLHILKVHAEDSQSLLLDRRQIALSMLRTLALRLRQVEQRIDAWMAS